MHNIKQAYINYSKNILLKRLTNQEEFDQTMQTSVTWLPIQFVCIHPCTTPPPKCTWTSTTPPPHTHTHTHTHTHWRFAMNSETRTRITLMSYTAWLLLVGKILESVSPGHETPELLEEIAPGSLQGQHVVRFDGRWVSNRILCSFFTATLLCIVISAAVTVPIVFAAVFATLSSCSMSAFLGLLM